MTQQTTNGNMELNDKQLLILKTAEKLFAEFGYDGTSVRQISNEARVNVAMISYYFGSKEKLLEALMIYRLKDFKVQVENIMNTKKNYFEKLDAFVEMMIKRVHKNRQVYKIVNFEYSSGARNISFETYENYKKDNFKIVENFVSNGQKEGIFSTNVNTHLIIPTILGTYFHFHFNQQFYQNLLQLKNKTEVDHYIHNTLTTHIQQTIKGLLTYEK